jgi:hypothetical protein
MVPSTIGTYQRTNGTMWYLLVPMVRIHAIARTDRRTCCDITLGPRYSSTYHGTAACERREQTLNALDGLVAVVRASTYLVNTADDEGVNL